MMFISGNVKTP